MSHSYYQLSARDANGHTIWHERLSDEKVLSAFLLLKDQLSSACYIEIRRHGDVSVCCLFHNGTWQTWIF